MVSSPDEIATVLAEVPLFAALPSSICQTLAAEATIRLVRAGEWLFRQGDEDRSLFVVQFGRLDVVIDVPPPERVVRTVGRGAVIGELAMLTESPRSASVRARRDSTLIEVRHDHFAMLAREPQFALALVRLLGEELRRTEFLRAEPLRRPHVIAIVTMGPLHSDAVRDGLVSALGPLNLVTLTDHSTTNSERANELERAERDHDLVLMFSDSPGRPWTEFCLRQADRVVLAVDAVDVPIHLPLPVGSSGIDLVFVGRVSPGLLEAWKRFTAVRAVHALSPGAEFAGTVGRLARRLTGQSTGLVLSGGGARGLAHVGVLQVLEEAGWTIDRVGGSSMGAFIGALYALRGSFAQIHDVCRRELVERKPFRDLTVPRVALTRGRTARSMLSRALGNALIEELTVDYFCVSADLVSAQTVVHRQGSLSDAVAASMAVPGLTPPVVLDGRLLIDGGVLDNLPIDAMAATEEGPVIAVDVMGRAFDVRFSGVEPSARLPGIIETLSRATVLGSRRGSAANHSKAAIVIAPDVHGIGLLDFDQFEQAVEAGRRAARVALEAGPTQWLSADPTSPPRMV
jgi:NTE family protein